MKKALKKYEGVMKTVGNRARKESKKGDSIVSVRISFPARRWCPPRLTLWRAPGHERA